MRKVCENLSLIEGVGCYGKLCQHRQLHANLLICDKIDSDRNILLVTVDFVVMLQCWIVYFSLSSDFVTLEFMR